MIFSLLIVQRIESIRVWIVPCNQVLRQRSVNLRQILVLCTTGLLLVVVTLVQIEAVQVIGYRTVVELLISHRSGNASTIIGSVVFLAFLIVAVD